MKNKLFTLLIFSSFLFIYSCKKDTVSPETDLSVNQSVSSQAPVIGSNITFTITAHNNGPSDATGVNVTDNLPTGFTQVSATATSGTFSGTAWTIGSLANGASATLNIVATVNSSGSYISAVSILGAQTDPNVLNNSVSVTPVPTSAVVSKVTYNADVKTILVNSCTPCHIAGGNQQNKWDGYAATKSNINAIIDRVSRAQGSAGFMPNGGTKLSADKISILNQWVTDGLLEK